MDCMANQRVRENGLCAASATVGPPAVEPKTHIRWQRVRVLRKAGIFSGKNEVDDGPQAAWFLASSAGRRDVGALCAGGSG